MEEVIAITESPIEKASLRSSQRAIDEDKEMAECLARLKVWRIENLMSPAGMDRFRQEIRTIKPANEEGEVSSIAAAASLSCGRKQRSNPAASRRGSQEEREENI